MRQSLNKAHDFEARNGEQSSIRISDSSNWTPGHPERKTKLAFTLAIIFAILTCLMLQPWTREYPLNDGGFWLLFASAIHNNGYLLPETIIFNGAPFPVSYPPLAGYLLALSHDVFNIEIITGQIWLPMGLYLACTVLFGIFSKRFFRSSTCANISTMLFPLMFFTHKWNLMGGGVPRGLGMALQLSVWSLALSTSDQRVVLRHASMGVLTGLTILSHPIASLWTIIGRLFLGPRNLRLLCIEAIGASVVALPWLTLVIANHGVSPFIKAFSSSPPPSDGYSFLVLLLSPERIVGGSFFGGLLLWTGIIKLLLNRDFRIPLLLVGFLYLDPRGLLQHNGSILTCLIVSVGILTLYELACPKLPRALTTNSLNLPQITSKASLIGQLTKAVLALLILYSIAEHAFSNSKTFVLSSNAQMKALTEYADRPESQGNVVFVNDLQYGDGLQEWLVTFGRQTVLNLHQMSEWHGRFNSSVLHNLHISWSCCRGASENCPIPFNSHSTTYLVERRSCENFRRSALTHQNCVESYISPDFSRITCSPPAYREGSTAIENPATYPFAWPRSYFEP